MQILEKYYRRIEGVLIQLHNPYDWALGQDFAIGELTKHGYDAFYCWKAHIADANHEPGIGTNWEDVFLPLATGREGPQGIPGGVMNWRGLYSASTVYALNDGVRSAEGYGYYSLQNNNTGHTPPTDGSDNAYWSCFAWKGDKGDKGEKGDKGDKGDTGPQGPQGEQGIPGTSDTWTAAGETWTYAGADSPTFTFKISGDKTSKYAPGMRIKLTQTTVKYFIIVAISYSSPNTTVTIYGGTDYTLVNAAITNPYYSWAKAPFGFPLDHTKWTVELEDTSNKTQSNPANNTFYNIGNISKSIPIGAWKLIFYVFAQVAYSAAKNYTLYVGLSTISNNFSDNKLISAISLGSSIGVAAILTREEFLNLSSKTTYYLVAKQSSGIAASNITFYGNDVPTIIRAVCAYL